ncbi:MAG TPA: lipoyl(octanoyl) transferase LipB [Gemmatimonadaceae bacterium]|nr:lipoyl(octanoyl) transferase LipB [Gemmatimonadaceae bacterium]
MRDPRGRELVVTNLGLAPYAETLARQRELAAARIQGTIGDQLLLCEHPPVVTLGRTAKSQHVTTPLPAGVELFEVERGGDVTFHGPGQLVGYPIIDLSQHKRDLHWYLRELEATLIDALATFGIPAKPRAGLTGVWTEGDRKIASIGVHARQWVTWHGFALNVTTNLSYFDLMVPCGIQGVDMTSMARERPDLGVDVPTAAAAVTSAFADHFALCPVD